MQKMVAVMADVDGALRIIALMVPFQNLAEALASVSLELAVSRLHVFGAHGLDVLSAIACSLHANILGESLY